MQPQNSRDSLPQMTTHAHWTIKDLGREPYEPVWHAMRAFTDARTQDTLDELWRVEHPPVFTQGLAGKPEHLLDTLGIEQAEIPLVQTDRGGQVTYHGPGQVVLYPLLNLERLGIGVRCLVDELEQTVIDVLAQWGVAAARKEGAPGVYIDGAKVGSIGLKVRKGFTYHGLAVNVDMDLRPFSLINPCGMAGLPMTHMAAHCDGITWTQACDQLTTVLGQRLGYHRT
ncbi:MAG TPA: lipoyl(octanoyl) transferase LipB [Wenzhouxiangella sp.]